MDDNTMKKSSNKRKSQDVSTSPLRVLKRQCSEDIEACENTSNCSSTKPAESENRHTSDVENRDVEMNDALPTPTPSAIHSEQCSAAAHSEEMLKQENIKPTIEISDDNVKSDKSIITNCHDLPPNVDHLICDKILLDVNNEIDADNDDKNRNSPKSIGNKRELNKRKSKRKSSFVCGRISRISPMLSSAELCENIDLSLGPEVRLAELVQTAFEYTIERLFAERGKDIDGFQQCAVHARNAVQEFVQGQQGTELLREATRKRSRNVKENKFYSTGTEKSQSEIDYIHHLKLEINKWDELLQHYKELLADTERKTSNASQVTISLNDMCLSDDKKSFLTSNLKSDDYLDELEQCKMEFVCAVDNVETTSRILNVVQQLSKEILTDEVKNIGSISFKGTSDPRDLIKNCLAYN